MKNILLLIVTLVSLSVFGQAPKSKNGLVKSLSPDAVGKLGYRFEVAYNKTSHIIFPAKIVYVDAGSDDIVCSYAETLENVLRVKANKIDFPLETNLTVATDDGNFWAFYITYNEFPTMLNIDVRTLKYNKSSSANSSTSSVNENGTGNDIVAYNNGTTNDKLFVETKTINKDSVLIETNEMNNSYASDIFQKIAAYDGSTTLGDESGRVKFEVKGIYNTDDYIFVKLRIYNKSKLKYRVEKVRFWNVDAVKQKNTSYQEIELLPVYSKVDNEWRNGGQEVDSKEEMFAYFMLPLFSIANNKQVKIQVNEFMGGRNGDIIIDYSSFYSNMVRLY